MYHSKDIEHAIKMVQQFAEDCEFYLTTQPMKRTAFVKIEHGGFAVLKELEQRSSMDVFSFDDHKDYVTPLIRILVDAVAEVRGMVETPSHWMAL